VVRRSGSANSDWEAATGLLSGWPQPLDGFASRTRKGTELARADGLVGDNLTAVQDAEHLYDRPSWDCRTCGDPWPCANAKASLAAEFQGFPSVLAIYLTAQMHDALIDLTVNGAAAPSDLYERFLAWISR
jgi:hypothetical protein